MQDGVLEVAMLFATGIALALLFLAEDNVPAAVAYAMLGIPAPVLLLLRRRRRRRREPADHQ